jgi:hypothetical protein
MKYQFQVDNRPAGPVHKDWGLAAQDAVDAGLATWAEVGEKVRLDSTQGASIARVE